MSQKNIANKSSQFTRKKIEDFSYGLNDVIGKGYSSQVYQGRNDETSNP
jgi:serine/threonine-protein kinase ULK/ATG1